MRGLLEYELRPYDGGLSYRYKETATLFKGE